MLSENLKDARTARGMTQEELAMYLNVTRQTISKWEKGLSVPDADLLIRLSEKLEIPVNELLGAKTDYAKEDTKMEDANKVDANKVAEQLSRVNALLAEKTYRTRRFVRIILTIFCLIFCAIVIFTMLQLTGTDLRGEITVTHSVETVAPTD